ncbi:hypothetical protein BH10PSE16_BH10PSE16_41670 [soil metagenome]
MLRVDQLSPQDFVDLSPEVLAELAAKVLAHVGQQSRQIDSQAQAIVFKDAKIASITFELRRLKAWRFGAKTECMNAEQRQDTVGELIQRLGTPRNGWTLWAIWLPRRFHHVAQAHSHRTCS